MTLKIQGSSIKKEYVHCINCEKKYIWLNAYETTNGSYYSQCAKCTKKIKEKTK